MRVAVLPLFAAELVPNGTAAVPGAIRGAFGGETVDIPFVLANRGNADDSFDLAAVVVAPSDFAPQGIAVHLDVDGDGIVDPGEMEVSRVGPLRQDEAVSLVLSATLPTGLAGGAAAHVDLRARSVSDTSSVDRDNVVRITAREDSRVALLLEASVSEVLPGDTIVYTATYSNPGERTATDVVVRDFIDFSGMAAGTEYVPGSAVSSVPGRIEFYDVSAASWIEVAPPAPRVKGVRLLLDDLAAGGGGTLSFAVAVRQGRETGDIVNAAETDWIGADALPYAAVSNEVDVLVGRVSHVAIGPDGNPAAPTGSPEDRVISSLDGAAGSCTLWYGVMSGANFVDTLEVILADSTLIPAEWIVAFVDSTGAPLPSRTPFRADLGAIPRGATVRAGLRLACTPEGLRRFAGRELAFMTEAASLPSPEARDAVQNVLRKGGMPLVSVKQSIREPTALVGDVLSFIVTVTNLTAETAVDSLVVTENLSSGLGFAGGSLEPRSSGNVLAWRIGRLEAGRSLEIVFRARVKAGQEMGRLASSAFVGGVTDLGERASDGPAWATVLIVDGIFTRRGILFGAVFIDADGDGLRSAGEKGVPGASIYLEDGTYAATDSAGLYSIPGIPEGPHVARIDPESIPDSLSAGSAGYYGLGVPGEALIDLPPSGNRRADFPLVPAARADAGAEPAASGESAPPSGAGAAPRSIVAAPESAPEPSSALETFDGITIPGTQFTAGKADLEEIPLSRIAALSLWMHDHPGWTITIEGHTDSIPVRSAEFPSNLELSIARARSVYQILRMNGIPEDRLDYTGYGARMPVAPNDTPEGRALNRRVEIRVAPPEGYAAGDPNLPAVLQRAEEDTASYALADSTGICSEIVKPEEGTVFQARGEIDVEVVSPLGSEVELYANGLPVGRERIGLKTVDIGNNTLGMIFYGVPLAEGRNDLLVVCREYGGERSTCVRHVYLAGKPKVLQAERELVRVNADGATAPELVFLVSDASGLPVRDGVFATVEGPADLIRALDANPQQAGVQAATAGGRLTLRLPPSRNARDEIVRVEMEGLDAGCRVRYEAPLRPWFLFGFGDLAAGWSRRTGSGTTLGGLDRNRDGGFAEGRAAFYGQGEVRSGHLLTAAVDTRPVYREDRLFRRIEPEKYYPIYGDASELKFNAASRSGTYLRLDHRRYSAMLGDFQTDLGRLEFTKYHRSMNGLSGEARYGRGSARAFITRTDQLTYQEELRAEGTSGFYFLSHYPLVEGSEKVRIEVRDRYRPERIVRVDYKQVNRDYDINYMDGTILFKEAVAAADENLNPVTIVVSYECRGGGSRNFLYGLRSATAIRDSLLFGATAVVEDEGAGRSSLVGVDLAGPIAAGVSIQSELAHSEKVAFGSGTAFRVALAGPRESALRWSLSYRDVDERFFNPSFSGGKTELGSRKIGGDLSWRVNEAYTVDGTAYHHALRERSEDRDYVGVTGRYRAGTLEGKLGLASASQSDTREGDHAAVLIRTGLGAERRGVKGTFEWDQILAGEEVAEYPNRLQAALSRRLWEGATASLKHEYRTGSRTGTRHLTLLGIESAAGGSMSAYSRYQLEGAASGERGQAIMGLKSRFARTEELTATAAIEKAATVSGVRLDDYFSFVTGALYTPREASYRVKGDYELRLEPERRKHLIALAGLKRLGLRWSGLAKGDLWYSDEKREADYAKGSSTVALSVRPRDGGPLTLLSLLKTVYEKNSPAHPAAVDKELLASIEANYLAGRDWELEGKVAARWVTNNFKDYVASASTWLWQAKGTRTIGGTWDVGAALRLVRQCETHTTRLGGGIELGRVLARNTWLGVGYDFGAHRDGDSPVNDFTANGFHVRLRVKFDEKIMKYFDGGEEAGE